MKTGRTSESAAALRYSGAHMLRHLRTLPALGAVFVAAIALSACGDSVPGNAVVRVGDETIERTEFQRWMQIAAISTQGLQQQGEDAEQPEAVVPRPPEFAECVAARRESTPEPAEGQPTPTAAQLKQQCEQEYETLRDQVLQFLISAEWILGEASDQGVTVTQAEVDEQFEMTREQSFPEEEDFETFLEDSGMTLQDIKFRVRLDTLSTKLRDKVTEGTEDISNDEVREYYEENRQQFAQPERRDLRIVLTEEEGEANEARAALESGRSWASVTEEFSIDEATKEQGGTLLAVAEGQQEQALDEAVFSAEQGELTGPVETQFGFYVFQVQKVTAAEQQTVQEAAASIRQLLAAQNQQESLDEFVTDFRDKWKDRTNCRDGFVTQDCKNAPEPETQTGPDGQPIPQQGVPQQGVPQQGVPQQVPEGAVPPQGGAVPQQVPEGAVPPHQAPPPAPAPEQP